MCGWKACVVAKSWEGRQFGLDEVVFTVPRRLWSHKQIARRACKQNCAHERILDESRRE